METGSRYRPRVSRETRLLLTAGVIAVAALWLLARIRFPDRPVTPNPVPSVLSQLASGPRYDDLAGEIAQLHARLQPLLLRLDAPSGAVGASPTFLRTTAIRLRDNLAVAVVPSGSNQALGDAATILVRDRASGLAVVRVVTTVSTYPPLVAWTPRQPQQSRYLFASDVSLDGMALRPVFVGSLDPLDSPLWSEQIWAVPARTDLAAGSLLFTSSAEFAGVVISHRGGLGIVPGAAVVAEAERLLTTPPGPPGTLGVEVQGLTPAMASLTGAAVGVVVAWVDADGAASEELRVGDVIEELDGRALATREHWDVRMARLSAGETLRLRQRRHGELREITVVALPSAAPDANRSLGLTLQTRSTIGAEVVRVDERTAADRAGLAVGDVITLVGDISAPTPAQVVRSYNSIAQGERVMIAITRGDAHIVTVLER
jgi:hypothetical protein